MNKYIFLIFTSLFITIVGLFTLIGTTTPATLYVGEGSNGSFILIGDAVDAAIVGDTIIVKDGLYYENLIIHTSALTIRSENGSNLTIVQAANPAEHVFEVTGDNVKIEGFTISGATEMSNAGVYVHAADYCEIYYNNISDNFNGIEIHSYGSRFVGNTVHSGMNYGIHLSNSNHNTFSRNIISNNRIGFRPYRSNKNNIYLNTFTENEKNIQIFESTNIFKPKKKISYIYNENTYSDYLGNKWSDYTGDDENNDGIGDTPYFIGENNMDNHTVMPDFEIPKEVSKLDLSFF